MAPDVLDLSGGDLSAGDFDPIASGTYPATIVKVEDKFTKGDPDAALPAGTPMLNVHLRLNEDAVDGDGNSVKGRYVFRSLIIPPAKVNGKAYEHFKSMQGQLAKFFICAGYDQELVMSGNFDLDYDDIVGREIAVKVQKYYNTYKKEQDNRVQGFKAISELSTPDNAGVV